MRMSFDQSAGFSFMSLLSVSTWSKRSEKRKKQTCEADERIFKDEAVGCFMVTDLWLNTRVSN